eukprot:5904907-Pleurochrysis_carterae.AAC.2
MNLASTLKSAWGIAIYRVTSRSVRLRWLRRCLLCRLQRRLVRRLVPGERRQDEGARGIRGRLARDVRLVPVRLLVALGVLARGEGAQALGVDAAVCAVRPRHGGVAQAQPRLCAKAGGGVPLWRWPVWEWGCRCG